MDLVHVLIKSACLNLSGLNLFFLHTGVKLLNSSFDISFKVFLHHYLHIINEEARGICNFCTFLPPFHARFLYNVHVYNFILGMQDTRT